MPDPNGHFLSSADFLAMAYGAMSAIGDIALFAAIIALGTCATAIVIAIPVCIIKVIIECIEEYRNRSGACEHGVCENRRQGLIENHEQCITVEVIEIFDEDACTTVGEEHGVSSVDLDEKANSEEHYLLKDVGQHGIEEDKESFDEDARTIFGDENGKSSIDLAEKLYLEESHLHLKDDGQHSV